MLDQLTSSQVSEWLAYDSIDPIGEKRDDFRMAYIASLLTNLTIQVHGKKGAKLTTPEAFMLDWEGKPKEVLVQSTETIKAIMMGIVKSQNARERNKHTK